jgi:TolB-like protein/Flp pilus assembly protein TadD
MEEISAIMMTDIVGFTELTRQKESTIKRISQKHKSVLQGTITKYGGRIVNIFGDGALAIFGSPVDAVKCAIEIQYSMNEDPVIPLRISLHYGKIINEGDEVYGEAINLASRILKVAVPFSILLSDRIKKLVENEPEMETRSIGIFNLKYVDRPVEILGLVCNGLVLPNAEGKQNEDTIHPNSIAVMPFLNLGGSTEDDFLGDGISEAIINALAKLSGMFVTARSSSFAFKESNKDVRELGRILGVANILEGSVQLHGNRLRVTAQLINTVTGFHVLSESYDKELLDIFSIQQEIAWLITQNLKLKIGEQEKNQLALPRTSNLKALEFYLQARYLIAKPKQTEMLKAIELLKRSIEYDPTFVLPYAGISICYLYLGVLRFMEEEKSNQLASEFSQKAIQLEPNLPEAMVVHALSTFWISRWNLKKAEQFIGSALRNAPGSAEIRLFHGMFTLMSGNVHDALIEILLANKLDPLNPNILSRLAYTYLCLKEYEEAHACFRMAHNTAPFAMYINYIIAWSYLLQEQYDKAESALQDVDEEKDVYQSTPGTLGFLYAKQGKLEKAYDQIQLISQMKEEGNIKFPHYNFALIYAGLNKIDEMFYHLDRAFAERPVHLMFIQADPFWEDYRKDRRYIDLVRRVFKRSPTSGKIILHSSTKEQLVLHMDQILYIEAEDNYSRVVWQEENNRKEKVLRATLRDLESQLSGSEIIRCHRSYLINSSKYSISGDSRGFRLVSASDSFKVPVSRSRSKAVIQRLTESE